MFIFVFVDIVNTIVNILFSFFFIIIFLTLFSFNCTLYFRFSKMHGDFQWSFLYNWGFSHFRVSGVMIARHRLCDLNFSTFPLLYKRWGILLQVLCQVYIQSSTLSWEILLSLFFSIVHFINWNCTFCILRVVF